MLHIDLIQNANKTKLADSRKKNFNILKVIRMKGKNFFYDDQCENNNKIWIISSRAIVLWDCDIYRNGMCMSKIKIYEIVCFTTQNLNLSL